MDEFTFKTMEVNSQVTEALRRNPSLRSKVAKALGLSDAQVRDFNHDIGGDLWCWQANPRVKMDDLILSPYNGRPYNAVAVSNLILLVITYHVDRIRRSQSGPKK